MRENIQLIDKENYQNDLIISYLREMYSETIWENNNIYFDSNYSAFLESSYQLDTINYYWLKVEAEIVGIAQILALNEQELHLNNIVIKKEFRRNKSGSKFLKLLLQERENYQEFSLNAFHSNEAAINWYKNLGFSTVDTTYIYIYYPQKTNTHENIIGRDKNGFKGVFVDDLKIATIIDSNVLLVHNIDNLSLISVNGFDRVLCWSKKTIADDCFNLYDTSYRMIANIKSLLKKLSTVPS